MSPKTDSEGQADRALTGGEFRSTVARDFRRSLATMGLAEEYDVKTEYAIKTPHAGMNGITKLDVAFLRGDVLVGWVETKTSGRDRRKQVTHDATVVKMIAPGAVCGFCYKYRNAETNGGQDLVIRDLEKFIREYEAYFPGLVNCILCVRADSYMSGREEFIRLLQSVGREQC